MSRKTTSLNPHTYYRLPWNLSDNAITWLEPTTKCNLYCEGCYRANDPEGHRPLGEVMDDLENLKRLRRTDGISIAGGEPLLYPEILELVRYVALQGWKPVIITNGTQLTPELIKDLKKAGLVGFTVHVDSHQHRPGWTGKTEEELNDLRTEYAELIYSAGKGRLACAFNATIYPDTVDAIPGLTRWAQEHIDKVQTMVYILFRLMRIDPKFDYFVGGRKLDMSELSELRYEIDRTASHKDVVVQEIVEKIREACPGYEPAAYLNSNQDGGAVKWLVAIRAGRPEKILGYMNGRFVEFAQIFHHYLFGSYLAYARPWLTNTVQALFPLAPFNGGLAALFRKWISDPSSWLRGLYMQTITILQPPDLLDDGRQAMCDGCPDAMYYKGRLLWKCRLDEVQRFGQFIRSVARAEEPSSIMTQRKASIK